MKPIIVYDLVAENSIGCILSIPESTTTISDMLIIEDESFDQIKHQLVFRVSVKPIIL